MDTLPLPPDDSDSKAKDVELPPADFKLKENVAKKPFKIYMLVEDRMIDNTYSTDRKLDFKRELFDGFDTLEEAQACVRYQTRTHPSTCGAVGMYLIGKSEEEKRVILDKFCFDEDSPTFYTNRRFFINKTNAEMKALIKKMCVNEGIRFQNS